MTERTCENCRHLWKGVPYGYDSGAIGRCRRNPPLAQKGTMPDGSGDWGEVAGRFPIVFINWTCGEHSGGSDHD